jgi:hypothetical protein
LHRFGINTTDLGISVMNSPVINEHSLHGARMLDAAEDILAGLRGYAMADVFGDILRIAAEYGVGPLPVSHASVDLAEGSRQTDDTPASQAAFRTWASLAASRNHESAVAMVMSVRG